MLASPSLFFAGMAGSRLPIAVAHGEGYADFSQRGDAAGGARARCASSTTTARPTEAYPFNPNGSPGGLTAVTTADGRFTALMPHPERVFRNVQMSWTAGDIGAPSPWMRMFRNARRWVADAPAAVHGAMPAPPTTHGTSMTTLIVRRLLVDLDAPFERRWNGGDAFRTAFFNALSMSFPAGEQFFIDAVRVGVKALPPERQAQRFADEVQGFIGQEATHRRIHALFNEHLARQGHVNAWEPRILRRIGCSPASTRATRLGITAATEHFTAIFAEHLLAHAGGAGRRRAAAARRCGSGTRPRSRSIAARRSTCTGRSAATSAGAGAACAS